MSNGWSIYVIVIVLANILGCAWLLAANRKTKAGDENESTGHEFDGIGELNNPLPAWWTWLFILSIVFAFIYLALFPGFGNFPGLLGWTSVGQWEGEMATADAKYGPIYAEYFGKAIPKLIKDQRAVGMGGRLFAINCSPCHGSDARGGKGYPNLTDDDWLYGGEPDIIVQTITHGRNGMMPPFGAAIGGEPAIAEVAQYVLSLSGRPHDAELAAKGQVHFATICFACHGVEAKGNPMIGSPNLTDDNWLHGGRQSDIEDRVRNGITSQMPAHGDILGPEKIHLLATYVYSLSNTPDKKR
jgi:cytochrome c oxidase cbb3-type subunit 3